MTGRYFVQKQTFGGTRWVVQDLAANPCPTVAGPYPTEAEAQAECDRLNTPPRPRQRPHQEPLFSKETL